MKLVFDIGGTSCKYGVYEDILKEIENDEVVYGKLINHQQLYKIVYDLTVNLIVKYHHKIEAIAISSPAIIDSATGEISGLSAIKNYHLINWKQDLKMFNLPIYFENDANCAALAELYYGNGKNINNFVVIVVGTGIGGSIIIDHKLYKGSFLQAGEYGCMLEMIDDNDQYINASLLASSYSISKRYQQYSNNFMLTKEIFSCYNKDSNAKLAIDEMIYYLSKLIINVAFVIDPQMVLIGGAISNNSEFMKMIEKQVDILLAKLNLTKKFKLLNCKFNNDANKLGALSLIK